MSQQIRLSNSEARSPAARAGQHAQLATSRSYADIISANVFNPVNLVLYVIGSGMFLIRDFRSALFTVGLVLFNAIVGMTQEIRAKRQLDRIALLARARCRLRDGRRRPSIPPNWCRGTCSSSSPATDPSRWRAVRRWTHRGR